MAQQAQKVRGGNKLRRCSKDKGYYERQHLKTAANKLRRATKRANRAAHWRAVRIQQSITP